MAPLSCFGRVALAVPDRGPTSIGFFAYGDARGILAGKLPPSGRLQRAALSHGEGDDLGGASGDLRSAAEQCPKLAGSAGEATHASVVWPILCGQSREAARG